MKRYVKPILFSLGIISATFFSTSLGNLISITSKAQLTNLLHKNEYVLIKLSADWCPTCKIIKKPFEKVANKKEFSNIAFTQVDITKNPDIALSYKARAIPKFLYIKNNNVIHQELGVKNIKKFDNYLTQKIKSVFSIKQTSALKQINPEKSIVSKTKQLLNDMWSEIKKLPVWPIKKEI